MPLVPVEWTVVILGAWNRAILTPSGISKRLFELPEGTPIEVYVPLDILAPFQVKYGDVRVIASTENLIVTPEKSTFDNLGKALKIAVRAMAKLPETPVSAAGFNLKYKSNKPMSALARLIDSALDANLSELGIDITTRALSRHTKWKQGEVRVGINQEPDLTYAILLNFHIEGDKPEKLIEWLSVSTNEIEQQNNRLLFDCLGLSEGDLSNGE